MSAIRFRPYTVGDPERVLEWHKQDQDGFESFLGISVPDSLACTMAISSLLQAVENGLAVFVMITHGEETIGFAGLTNITPDRTCGQPHIYIAPSYRRYSIAAARAAEQYAANHGVRQVMISVEDDNRRGLALAKRLHYHEVPRRTFLKELQG
jgi:RimJ/RimL family protein N-acetyltransferase